MAPAPRRRNVAPVSPAGLKAFFQRLVNPAFATLGIGDREVVEYVAELLGRFARSEHLYRIRDAQGKELGTIAEMLLELSRQWSPDTSYSFDRELDIRRHCGDYALFMSGMFRAYAESRDLLDYYLAEGRREYHTVAELRQMAFAPDVQLFQTLSDQFEHFSGALDYLRKVHLRPDLHSGPYREIVQGLDIF
jgi:hypothetical protein